MKSHGDLFDTITSLPNLERSMFLAAKGKMNRVPVINFINEADTRLPCLRDELLKGDYAPRPYIRFHIKDPKPRTISCADFRDRVVHHAVCDVIGPVVERRFIEHSYACRVGKGSHRAVFQAQRYARKFQYFCKMDIRRFFDSVDHEILMNKFCRLFREWKLIGLVAAILRHGDSGTKPGRGLPIGNLTSQWFANIYLDRVDHLIKDDWGMKGYIRYMDDILLFHDRKYELRKKVEALDQWLRKERKLEVKREARILAPVAKGIPFLGMLIYPRYLRLQHNRYHRSKRLVRLREKQFELGVIDERHLVQCVQSVYGIFQFFGLKVHF